MSAASALEVVVGSPVTSATSPVQMCTRNTLLLRICCSGPSTERRRHGPPTTAFLVLFATSSFDTNELFVCVGLWRVVRERLVFLPYAKFLLGCCSSWAAKTATQDLAHGPLADLDSGLYCYLFLQVSACMDFMYACMHAFRCACSYVLCKGTSHATTCTCMCVYVYIVHVCTCLRPCISMPVRACLSMCLFMPVFVCVSVFVDLHAVTYYDTCASKMHVYTVPGAIFGSFQTKPSNSPEDPLQAIKLLPTGIDAKKA